MEQNAELKTLGLRTPEHHETRQLGLRTPRHYEVKDRWAAYTSTPE